ncbi:MAG: hypothetical protein WBC91_12730 [Phototrophicaceae bacterium]
MTQQLPFNPNNLPERPTAIFDTSGTRIGTFNPHTLIIHPMGDTSYGPMKLLGSMAFDMNGKIVGKFNAEGQLSPIEPAQIS